MNASEMGWLVKYDAKKARARILRALREEGMHRGRAARRLGCTHGTLIQWTTKLGMLEELRALDARSERDGWRAATAGVGGARKGAGRPKNPAPSPRPKAARKKRPARAKKATRSKRVKDDRAAA